MRLTYSAAAQNDLDRIADYTTERWSGDQADQYLTELEDCCTLLSQPPEMGRLQSFAVRDLRRFDQGSHAIYYLPRVFDILIVRILHQRMVPTKYDLPR